MKKTIVNFILDESGSMGSIKDATISGVNEYFDMLKQHGKVVRVSLTKFNGKRIVTPFVDTAISKELYLDANKYLPDDLTPLYDAIGSTIKSVDESLRKAADKPAILVVIMTDGQENYSKEYKRDKILDLVKQKESEGWTFVYLGANQDSWLEGEKIGIYGNSTINWDFSNDGIRRGFSSLKVATCSYLASDSAATTDFFSTSGDEIYSNKLKNGGKKECKDN